MCVVICWTFYELRFSYIPPVFHLLRPDWNICKGCTTLLLRKYSHPPALLNLYIAVVFSPKVNAFSPNFQNKEKYNEEVANEVRRWKDTASKYRKYCIPFIIYLPFSLEDFFYHSCTNFIYLSRVTFCRKCWPSAGRSAKIFSKTNFFCK